MEAFKARMRERKKRQDAPVVPQNQVDRVVALMLHRFNSLANDLLQIDADRGPRGGAAMRHLGQ
jgi:hypothetical protein